MTDRELLEAAARAAGIDEVWRFPFGKNGDIYIPHAGLWAHRDTSDDEGALRIWNPLTDDGDEARLEAVLGMDVEWFGAGVSVCGAMELYSDHANDRQTARRRAGVRAAAEIGRAS